MTSTTWPSFTRGQSLVLAALIVLLYTWVLLPDAWLSVSFMTLASREDGLVESLGALSLLVASGLFFYCFLRARRAGSERIKQLFLLGLAVALFIGAGEEVSWGQRALGYETPEVVRQNNYQDELTLHNIEEAGYWGVWQGFKVFTLLFVVALPLTAWRNPKWRALLLRHVPIIPLAIGGLFLLAELMNALALFAYPNQWVLPDGTSNDVLSPNARPWEGNSTSEAAYSLLWAVVALDVLRRQVRSDPGRIRGRPRFPPRAFEAAGASGNRFRRQGRLRQEVRGRAVDLT